MATVSDFDVTTLKGRRVKVMKTYSPTCYVGMVGTITDAHADGRRAVVTVTIDVKPGRRERTNWIRQGEESIDELRNLELLDAPVAKAQAPSVVCSDSMTLLTLI
ncbi:MAG: hypothetical protein JRN62_03270 [Nitrososphaerota archaeon]|jgi:hypothetical protein|nr:hypothetical protein [Nitrososphaerota archaeon]MDG6948618.1 hypothetical protein [Nitrososphaerota archaeon]